MEGREGEEGSSLPALLVHASKHVYRWGALVLNDLAPLIENNAPWILKSPYIAQPTPQRKVNASCLSNKVPFRVRQGALRQPRTSANVIEPDLQEGTTRRHRKLLGT